eukprot:scaffold91063_cov49-Attheya_sp.AAC.2
MLVLIVDEGHWATSQLILISIKTSILPTEREVTPWVLEEKFPGMPRKLCGDAGHGHPAISIAICKSKYFSILVLRLGSTAGDLLSWYFYDVSAGTGAGAGADRLDLEIQSVTGALICGTFYDISTGAGADRCNFAIQSVNGALIWLQF